MVTVIGFEPDEFVQEGVHPAPGVLVLASTLGDDEIPRNRVRVGTGERWLSFGFRGEGVLSVDATPDGRAFALGENGTMVGFDWRCEDEASLKASRILAQNATAMSLGPLRRLRILNGTVCCGGSAGQVYAWDGERFTPLIRVANETVEDLGVLDERLVVLTQEGRVAALEGGRWEDLGFPPGRRLNALCPFGEGLAVVGKGTVIHGVPGRWEAALAPVRRTYWGVATHQGVVYAAHLSGVDRLEHGAMVPVRLPAVEGATFAVLRSGPDGVWAFAGQTVIQVEDVVTR